MPLLSINPVLVVWWNEVFHEAILDDGKRIKKNKAAILEKGLQPYFIFLL